MCVDNFILKCTHSCMHVCVYVCVYMYVYIIQYNTGTCNELEHIIVIQISTWLWLCVYGSWGLSGVFCRIAGQLRS